jgi:hypothetical protein
MISACRTVLDQESPIAAFIDGWVLSVRMSQYFRDGEGAALYGEHKEIAIGAADRIEEEIERIGKLFLAEDSVAETRESVHTVALANPIQGIFSNTVVYATEVPEGRPNPFTRALDVPMAPFRALGGVDQGAVAMNRMVDTAQDFTGVVEALPESTRWQLLLLLLEMDETEMVRSFRANASRIAESSSRLATVAEQLPEEVHAEISVLLEEIETKQPALNAALAQAENTAARIESAVMHVGSAADTIGRSAQSLTETGRAWESAVKTFSETFPQTGQEEPSTAADSPPFDINEYRSAADAVTTTATELRQLVLDLRGLIESQSLANHIVDLDTRINEAIRHSSAESRGLINHAVLCAAGLIVLVFVLAMIYRAIAGSRARVPEGGQ